MITSSDASAPFTELRMYLTNGRTTSKEKSVNRVKRCELSELLLLNVSVCCLKAKELHPGTSEAAIDALCVSGLIQYPPSEGGPLSYLVRNGKDNCIKKFKSLHESVCSSSHQFKDVCDVDVCVTSTLFSEVSLNSDNREATIDNYRQLQSEGNYLTSSELVEVGPAHGVLNKEVFLSIIMFNIVLLLLLLVIIFLPLLYLCC